MLAAALSLALFGYWGVLGSALLALLYTDRRSCQRLVVAPAVGIGVTVLPTFWLNRAGIPVRDFAGLLAAGLLLASLAVLAWRRPLVPVRHLIPFGLAVLVASLLTGRPMLAFGFDWVSVANDDMANYCLLAQRLLTRGYFDPPAIEAVRRGLDYSGYFYWTYHLAGARPGPELLLAWLAGVTRLNPIQVFMPCILAGHLALIGAVAALVYQTRRHRAAAILTAWLLAIGALVSLGALYQLLAQVTGLALLSSLAAVLLQPVWSSRRRRLLGLGVLAGLLGAALVVVYTEAVPFAGAVVAAFLTVLVSRRRRSIESVAWVLASASLVALVALYTYTRPALAFLLAQSRAGTASLDEGGSASLFPYFFLPSGLAQATGLQPLALFRREPWLSLSITLGAALLLLTVAATLRLARRGEPIAFVTAIMLTVGVGLFTARAAFGLFKLVLFFQPFMLATLALGWRLLGQRSVLWALALVVLAAGNLAVQASYVAQSDGTGSMSELREASALRIPAAFGRALADAGPTSLDLDTANLVLAKLQALYFGLTPATFLNREFFYLDRSLYGNTALTSRYSAMIPEDRRDGLARFTEAVASRRTTLRFPLGEDGDGNRFSAPRRDATAERIPGGSLALTTGRQSVFNRRQLGLEHAPILVKPYAQVSNHLVLVNSRLGQHYYGPEDRRRIALYQLERDPLYPGRTMAAVGRHLLFRVVNPGASVRLELDVSASFKGDGVHRLPPAAVHGTARAPLPLIGAGSARVVSPVVVPREIEGYPYVALDMGVDGDVIPVPRTGLMSFYGRNVPIDSRRIVVFARDISLVPEEEYAAQRPPGRLSRFPADLANPSLEYSGLSEDGWMREAAFVVLTRPAVPTALVVRGSRPVDQQGGDTLDLIVLLDGREVARANTAGPDVTVRVAALPGPARSRIDLRVSPLVRLAPPDNRRVGLWIRSIGFEP